MKVFAGATKVAPKETEVGVVGVDPEPPVPAAYVMVKTGIEVPETFAVPPV